MFDHQEHEQYPQADRWHGEEVNGDNPPDVILEEFFQVCDGGRLTVRKTRDSVRSETSIPSFCNSP
jgi:hypothetical protein